MNDVNDVNDAMTIYLVQYDSRGRDIPELAPLFRINQGYCERHGYTYTFYPTSHDRDYPPYWVKVKAVMSALEEGAAYVAWVDSDAVVHDLERTIESFFAKAKGKDVIITPDPPVYGSPFCAGNFLVRNTSASRAIMKKWWEAYDSGAWARDPNSGEWECVYQSPRCDWAGPQYEQGAFINLFLERKCPERSKILIKHYSLMNWWCFKACRYGKPFILHFMGDHKQDIPDYITHTQNRSKIK